MEQKNYDNPTKSPVIQEIIMSNRIGAIAVSLAERLSIDMVMALKMFYRSDTCARLHDKSTGLYLYGDLYIAYEFVLEMQIASRNYSSIMRLTYTLPARRPMEVIPDAASCSNSHSSFAATECESPVISM